MTAKSKRILALLRDPRHRDKLLDAFNQDTQSEGAPVGRGAGGEKFLREMNEMEDAHDAYMDSLKGAGKEG